MRDGKICNTSRMASDCLGYGIESRPDCVVSQIRSIDSIFGSSPLLIYLAGHRHLPMTSTFDRDATQVQKVLSEALLTIELCLADQILFEASRPIKRSFVWIERR